jgi:ribosomal protein S18 acetylase RimI-like enzyme
MLVRPACLEDYPDFSRLYLEINDLHAAAHPGLFALTRTPPHDQEDFQMLLYDPNQAVFIAEIDGEAAGFINVVLRDAPPLEILVPRRFAVIDSIGVNRSFRRLGAGQALMQRAEQWASEKGAVDIELTVYEFNRSAITFYEQLGYTPLSRKLSKPLTSQG